MNREQVLKELKSLHKKAEALERGITSLTYKLASPEKKTDKLSSEKLNKIADAQKEYTEGFLAFYKLYDIQKTKKTAFAKWKRMTVTEREQVMQLVPYYKAAFELKYRKYPNNFLANDCWKDYLYLLEQARQNNQRVNKIAEAQKKRLDAYNF